MLCQKCETLITLVILTQCHCEYLLHDSGIAFSASIEAGCFTCCYLWDGAREPDHSSKWVDPFSRRFPDGRAKIRLEGEMTIRMLWTTSQDSTHARFTAFPTEDLASAMNQKVDVATVSTSAQPDLWCNWLHSCMESHQKCRQRETRLASFTPDRLVEVFQRGNGNEQWWRLVKGADLGSAPYLTLSHCWGSEQPAQLLKEDSTFFDLQPASCLPKTYQDALSITLTLGFRFIWIDSLCIVQDDDMDWKSQSSLMGSIYENSTCNIAATWAMDGSDGCFSHRQPASINSATIQLPSQSGGLVAHEILAMDSYLNGVTCAPLNRRGWVTQERFLSRRQLNFGRREVYWECDELIASEHFPKGVPDELWDLTTLNQDTVPGGHHSLNFDDEIELRQAWAALVSQYSDCDFSRRSDKFIALAGLANKMRDATGDEYIAGLWRKDLHRQLCWVADIDCRFRFDRYTESTCAAPTWSWVNAEGPVMYDLRYFAPENDSVSLSEVGDVIVQSEDPLNTHSFVCCKLFLRGIAVWANVKQRGDPADVVGCSKYSIYSNVKTGSYKADDLIGPGVTIEWDENCSVENMDTSRGQMLAAHRQQSLLFMLFYIDNGPHIFGLVLRKLPSSSMQDNLFVRMGRFTDLNEQKFVGEIEKRMNLTRDQWLQDGIDLKDKRLSDMIQTIIVV